MLWRRGVKIKVKINGLDCPNCAKSLEGEINKLDGVKNAEIDFLKATLSFECTNKEEAIRDIVGLTKEIEPDAKIIVGDDKKTDKKNKFNLKFFFDCLLLVVGIAIGAIILFVKMPAWAYWTLYVISALMLGYKTYIKAVKLLLHGKINENLLITISVIGATFVSEHLEGLMVIALYSIGKIFEGLAVDKSRRSIEQLAKLQPEEAVVLGDDGTEIVCKPEEVGLGSIVIVRAGQKVPLDGIILQGSCNVDMQSLTGESVPIKASEGDEILSGSIVLDGVIKFRTTSEQHNSTISKIMNLVENASENKSKTETFISKLTKWYTLGIILLSLVVWGITFAVTKDINVAVYRGLIFLVISCPCAFAISVPLTYFGGLGNASKHGILIKGSNYLDACARLNMVAFDKTGTLTTGNFSIEKIITHSSDYSEEEILNLCAIGEKNSIHPLAKAIVSSCNNITNEGDNIKEIAGKGVEFSLNGKEYFVGRGEGENQSAQTSVVLFENGIKIGEILLSDTIKPTSIEGCQSLKKLGIKSALLSGDNKNIVKKVADEIGIEEAYGELLPQDKYDWIKGKKDEFRIGYVGDGINDAPSLALADVGISMGINGSPASIEASDIVLVDDNPEKIATAIKISKYTKKIVIENIALSAGIKVIFLALGSFGVTGMLSAVFADVGVTLLAIFNSLRALKKKIK